MSKPIAVSEANFQAEVIGASVPVIVDFWATWCTPCRMLTPILEELGAEHPEIKICKLNVDDAQDLAEKYGVMTLPTLLFFKDGEMIEECIGLVSKDRLLSLLPN